VQILTFAEENNLYNSIKAASTGQQFNTLYVNSSNLTADVKIDWAICPTWTGTGRDASSPQVAFGGASAPEGMITYRGSVGRLATPSGDHGGGIGQNTAASATSGTNNGGQLGFAMFRDGTSKTIQLTENAFAVNFLDGTGTYSYFADNVDDNGTTPAASPAASAKLGIASTGGLDGATSEHVGGLFGVCMADGASKFLNTNISPVTYEALITRNNGESIGEEY
jgi:hypothetical protein